MKRDIKEIIELLDEKPNQFDDEEDGGKRRKKDKKKTISRKQERRHKETIDALEPSFDEWD